ncbi:M23 family metallopeptidase [Candidatus Aerophobetes bacterium]|nr:M23 family metallopeptidase [Candidatus Aerophobetes bacterium]
MKKRKNSLKILVKEIMTIVFVFLIMSLNLNVSEEENIISEKNYQKRIKNQNESNEVSSDHIVIEGILKRGDSLYSSLRSQGISPKEINELKKALSSMVNVNSLPLESKYCLIHNSRGEFVKFIYNPNPIDTYIVSPSLSGELKVYKKEPILKVVRVEGEIEDSLYNAMLKAKGSPELSIGFANIFSWQIDFNTESRRGDTFKLIVEEEEQNNFSRPRRILAAQYEGELTGKHTAILFEDSNGQRDYYTPEGKSLKKAFLRAPLKYKYISSPFSYSRLHPILRIRRPHLGIDYAAPIGTPVVAIAEGVVTMVSYANDCGRYIKIKHLKGYESVYAHLSRYAKGIKKGVHVRQGQIIGYVGSSGLSTGPHLYFAISKNGKRINFLKMKMPSISSINPEYISQFEEIKKEYLSLLNGGEYGKISPLNTCISIPIQSERG